MIDTMARQPEDTSSDESTPVEEVDVGVDDTDPRSGRFSGSGNQDFPDGVIALRSRKDNNQFYISITDIVDELGYDAGEDYLHCRFEAGGADEPAILIFEHVPNPTDIDKQNDRTRKIVDNQTSARLFLPEGELGEFGLGLDLESYDTDDPYLFEPVIPPADGLFYLAPLGHVSEVFRYDERNASLYPEGLVTSVADDFDIDVEDLEEPLDVVSKTLARETFTAADLPIGDGPTVVSVGGQRVAIYDAPAARGESSFMQLLVSIYDVAPEVAEAIWRVHQLYADWLLSQLGAGKDSDAERTADNPIEASDKEAVIIPLDPPQEAAEPTDDSGQTDAVDEDGTDEAPTQSSLTDHGEVEQSVVVPVQPSVERLASQSHDVDQDALHEALETVATQVTVDSLQEAGVLANRDAVQLPFESEREDPVTYSAVELVFLEEGALPDLITDLDIEVDETVREAAQQAHNKQAEDLITRRPDAPAHYRKFRQDADAVVVPVLEE